MVIEPVELKARIALLRQALASALHAIEYACDELPTSIAEEVRAHIDGTDGLNAFAVLKHTDSFRALRILALRERKRVVRTVGRIMGDVVDRKLLLTMVNEEMKKYDR